MADLNGNEVVGCGVDADVSEMDGYAAVGCGVDADFAEMNGNAAIGCDIKRVKWEGGCPPTQDDVNREMPKLKRQVP